MTIYLLNRNDIGKLFREPVQEAIMMMPAEFHPRGFSEYNPYMPDPGRLEDLIAEVFSHYKDEEVGFKQSNVVEELQDAVEYGTSHGMDGTFGHRFVDGLKAIGGKFFVTADLEVTKHYYNPKQLNITVKNVEFDTTMTPETVVASLTKIATKLQNSQNPDRKLVISDLNRLLKKLI